jgi:hypothetical protein
VMKHTQFVSKSVVLVLLAFVGQAALAASKAGQVSLIKGEVFVVDPTGKVVADPEGKNGRRKFIQGADFFVGETVQTKPNGRVKLKFLEAGNEVTLGPSTSLVIERAGSGGKDKGTTLNLLNGDVRSDVKGKYAGEGSDTYQVKTKNAVAGVRGTIFLAQYNAKSGAFNLATEKGAVAVSLPSSAASTPPVLVGAGKFTSTTPGGALSAPAPIASNPTLSAQVSAMAGGGSSDSSGDGSGDGGDRGTASDGGGDKKSDKGDKTDKSDASSSKGEKSDKGDGSKGKGSDSKSGGEQASGPKTDAPSGGGDEGSGAPLGRQPVAANSEGGTSGRGPASAGGPPPPAMMGPSMQSGQMPRIDPTAMMGNIMNNVNQAQQNATQSNAQQNQKARVTITIGP